MEDSLFELLVVENAAVHRADTNPGETNGGSKVERKVGCAAAINLGRTAENIVSSFHVSEK